jgi:FtsH-binding integral membrane protein
MDLGQDHETPVRAGSSSSVDADPQSFVVRSFGWMFVGLALSAGVAAWFAANGDTATYFEDHPLVFVGLLLAELGIVAGLGLGVRRIGAQTATFLFCLFAGINGLVFSVVFSLYTSAQIAPAFAAAAGMFGAMVLYGYFTKRDLDSFGSLLFMGFVGLLLALLFNLIWASTTLYWLTTFGGVTIFAGMAAWNVQKLKEMGAERSGVEAENLAIFGALLLCLEFANLFLYMLRLFGGSGGPGGSSS